MGVSFDWFEMNRNSGCARRLRHISGERGIKMWAPKIWVPGYCAVAEAVAAGVAVAEAVAGDILAYFDHPHTSNGPTEAINGRLEHLRGSALGFRNLTHYITRCLLETGGFRPQLHPQL